MTSYPIGERIKFSDVPLGQRFYDPINTERFVKQSETTAAMVTGIGDGISDLLGSAEPLLYRLAAYFMTSLLDDPAMLALAFC